MLTTYLNNQPYSKFVLIEDSLEQPGKNILKHIIDSHTKASECKIIYFTFEGNFEGTKRRFPQPNIELHDCVSDSRGWLNSNKKLNFLATLSVINKSSCVVVIDSLAHAIYQYGLVTVYRTLHQLLKGSEGLLRIVTVLHQDLCENTEQITHYFEYLATLVLSLEASFNSVSGRVLYTYKKSSGKIIRKLEEYQFVNGFFKSEPLKKIDTKALLQESLKQVLPESLTTFKITLNDKEKESRDKLVLPYLPKEDGVTNDHDDDAQAGSKIFYQLDETDDWDEEDPDDDLDI